MVMAALTKPRMTVDELLNLGRGPGGPLRAVSRRGRGDVARSGESLAPRSVRHR